MIKQVHFCAGLPRAGSTVLMNILQQNPRLFTTGTCALPHVLNNVVIKSRFKEEFQAMSLEQADSALYGFIQMGVQGWFAGLTQKPVVISKNRGGWTSLAHLFPNSKFIAMVRDLRDVVESFERVNDSAKVLHTFEENLGLIPAMTESEKYHYYFKTHNPLLGVLSHDLPRLLDLHQKDSSRVLFVKYEDLIYAPQAMIHTVYDFLGEEPFQHNLGDIQQSEMYEHDLLYFRERTSHKTKKSILDYRAPERKLSATFHAQVFNENQNYYQTFYPEITS